MPMFFETKLVLYASVYFLETFLQRGHSSERKRHALAKSIYFGVIWQDAFVILILKIKTRHIVFTEFA